VRLGWDVLLALVSCVINSKQHTCALSSFFSSVLPAGSCSGVLLVEPAGIPILPIYICQLAFTLCQLARFCQLAIVVWSFCVSQLPVFTLPVHVCQLPVLTLLNGHPLESNSALHIVHCSLSHSYSVDRYNCYTVRRKLLHCYTVGCHNATQVAVTTVTLFAVHCTIRCHDVTQVAVTTVTLFAVHCYTVRSHDVTQMAVTTVTLFAGQGVQHCRRESGSSQRQRDS
jgi:hypothetical protein